MEHLKITQVDGVHQVTVDGHVLTGVVSYDLTSYLDERSRETFPVFNVSMIITDSRGVEIDL